MICHRSYRNWVHASPVRNHCWARRVSSIYWGQSSLIALVGLSWLKVMMLEKLDQFKSILIGLILINLSRLYPSCRGEKVRRSKISPICWKWSRKSFQFRRILRIIGCSLGFALIFILFSSLILFQKIEARWSLLRFWRISLNHLDILFPTMRSTVYFDDILLQIN